MHLDREDLGILWRFFTSIRSSSVKNTLICYLGSSEFLLRNVTFTIVKQSTNDKDFPSHLTETKPGHCPVVQPDQMGTCQHECDNDMACPDDQKCCSNGCGMVCSAVTLTTVGKISHQLETD